VSSVLGRRSSDRSSTEARGRRRASRGGRLHGSSEMVADPEDWRIPRLSCAGGRQARATQRPGVSWEFRDSSHGEAYRRGSTLVTMGPARDCANRDTSVYPGSGPSRLEVNAYFLPASY
jgi:hypothetical protein